MRRIKASLIDAGVIVGVIIASPVVGMWTFHALLWVWAVLGVPEALAGAFAFGFGVAIAGVFVFATILRVLLRRDERAKGGGG